jgi:hypothetical protein
MRRGVLVVWLLLGLGLVPAAAPAVAEPVARTYAAPVDRVWSAPEALLKHLGWKIERADRSMVFKRDRILWMDKDEPVTTPDRTVEMSFLEALGRAL